MKKYVFLLLILLLCSSAYTQRYRPSSSTPNATSGYENYEQRDVRRYRDKITFTPPEIPAAPNVDITPIQVEPVGYYFRDGRKVVIDAPPELDRLINKHKQINRSKTRVDGYRIQIYGGRGSANVDRVIGIFLSNYPDVRADRHFTYPIYKVRVGDFMRREDAVAFLRKVREIIPDAFIVKDRVLVPKYKPSEELQGYNPFNNN